MKINKTKKIPIRTCVYTKIKEKKTKMLRLVTNDDNIYILDKEKKIQKRAIYIYPCKEVINIIQKNKKYIIDDKTKEEIIEYIKVGGMNE